MTLTRRTALRRTGPPKRRTRLSSMSAKRRDSLPARRAAVAEALARDGRMCQAQRVWTHRCFGPLVGHEPRKRSQGGDPCDPDQVLSVCAWVNALIEDEPVWARSVGLAVRGSETWSWSRDWKRS